MVKIIKMSNMVEKNCQNIISRAEKEFAETLLLAQEYDVQHEKKKVEFNLLLNRLESEFSKEFIEMVRKSAEQINAKTLKQEIAEKCLTFKRNCKKIRDMLNSFSELSGKIIILDEPNYGKIIQEMGNLKFVEETSGLCDTRFMYIYKLN